MQLIAESCEGNNLSRLKISCAFRLEKLCYRFSDSHLWDRISVCRSSQSALETLWERMGKRLPNPSFISYKFLLWYFHNLFSFKLISFKSGAPRGKKCKYPCNFSPLCIYLQTAQYQEKTKRENRLSFITQLQLLMKTPLPASLCN